MPYGSDKGNEGGAQLQDIKWLSSLSEPELVSIDCFSFPLRFNTFLVPCKLMAGSKFLILQNFIPLTHLIVGCLNGGRPSIFFSKCQVNNLEGYFTQRKLRNPRGISKINVEISCET